MCFLWIYFLPIVDIYFIPCFGVWGGPGRISRFVVPCTQMAWSKVMLISYHWSLKPFWGGWLCLPFINEMISSVETENKKHLTGKFAPGLFKSNGCPNYWSCIPLPAQTQTNVSNSEESHEVIAWKRNFSIDTSLWKRAGVWFLGQSVGFSRVKLEALCKETST